MAPDAQRYSSLTTHHSSLSFAIASRDELWLNGVRVESRLSHGVARDFSSRIDASDDFDEELVHACDELIARLRRSVVDGARMRLVAGARRVREVVMTEATITTTIGGVSIVGSDVDALRTAVPHMRRMRLARPPCDRSGRHRLARVNCGRSHGMRRLCRHASPQ